MSVRITPEPISISVVNPAAYRGALTPSSRPVEPTSSASADPQDGRNANSRTAEAITRLPDRAPGIDPATLPQSLFDAALIASQFKADAILREQVEKFRAEGSGNTEEDTEASDTAEAKLFRAATAFDPAEVASAKSSSNPGNAGAPDSKSGVVDITAETLTSES